MIAVLAKESEHDVVREFFELFKTPWCFFDPQLEHEVLICTSETIPATSARLVVIYGGIAKSETTADGRTIVRAGFDLFSEVAQLLRAGQPASDAARPTLDLHIAALRELILRHGVSVLEIPPVPEGYAFIACLTHDVDHARVRYHKFDHTIAGFLYRALLGSLVDLGAGRKTAAQVGLNWKAAFSLPFVRFGWMKDFWDQFDRYLAIEDDALSTFFFVPHRDHPGKDANGASPSKRAVRYRISDVAGDIAKLRNRGREIALHGIDAWRDSEAGKSEREALAPFTDSRERGVRMHWLFFDQDSPTRLEQAGFTYDSTFGYNNVIGYRAGTSQCFKPQEVKQLLELPLHIMDTALFFPSHMHLSEAEAGKAIEPLLENASQLGGVLTVNWHDRSLGPERLWDQSYQKLLDELRARNAWFATAANAVHWFRRRRSASFEVVRRDGTNSRVKVSAPAEMNDLPGLQLRVYRPNEKGGSVFTDSPLRDAHEMLVAA